MRPYGGLDKPGHMEYSVYVQRTGNSRSTAAQLVTAVSYVHFSHCGFVKASVGGGFLAHGAKM